MQRIITGNLVLAEGTRYGKLVLENGIITAVEALSPFQPGAPIVTAGFIDIHFHGLGPYHTFDEENLRGIARFAPSTGVTSFTPAMGACAPQRERDFLESTAALTRHPEEGACCLGAHLEGPFLDVAHSGGMLPSLLRRPDEKGIAEILKTADGTLRMVTLAPEIPGGLEAVRQFSAAGVTVSLGHSGASPEVFKKAVEAGLTHICHLFDTYDPRPEREGVMQVSLADACLVDDRVSVELIADGFHVLPELLMLAIRAAGVDRITIITDALQGTGLPNNSYRGEDGTLYYLDNDSVCRAQENGLGIVGSCLTMERAFRNLVLKWGFSLSDASKMISANPAKAIHVTDRGRLLPGSRADINILSAKELLLEECIVGGESCFLRK